jgi:hypothetical protein
VTLITSLPKPCELDSYSTKHLRIVLSFWSQRNCIQAIISRPLWTSRFCVRSSDYDPARLGFYLIKAMGSEQAGLTGVKGSVVRKAAVDRPVSSLRNVLAAARNAVEGR